MTREAWFQLMLFYLEETAKKRCQRIHFWPCDPDSFERCCTTCTARHILEC